MHTAWRPSRTKRQSRSLSRYIGSPEGSREWFRLRKGLWRSNSELRVSNVEFAMPAFLAFFNFLFELCYRANANFDFLYHLSFSRVGSGVPNSVNARGSSRPGSRQFPKRPVPVDSGFQLIVLLVSTIFPLSAVVWWTSCRADNTVRVYRYASSADTCARTSLLLKALFFFFQNDRDDYIRVFVICVAFIFIRIILNIEVVIAQRLVGFDAVLRYAFFQFGTDRGNKLSFRSTVGTSFPPSSFTVMPAGMPFCFATRKSSAPKVGDVNNTRTASSVVTKSPVTTWNAFVHIR